MPVYTSIQLSLRSGKKLKSNSASVARSEIAESIGEMMLLEHFNGKGTLFSKHPNDSSHFPDYQVDEQLFDFKSVLHKNPRKWNAANLIHFKDCAENRDPYYLDSILIEFDIEQLGESYVIHDASAGNIWDFSRGGVSITERSEATIKSTSAKGYDPEGFCKNLDFTTSRSRLHVPREATLATFKEAGYI